MRGVNYIHEMEIAHRDLKPENLLLSSNGCLKISDFGSAECFRLGWENQIHMSRTRRGSRPFVSPEQYLCEEFDPRPVDIWAAAMTYLVMRTGRIPWKIATDQDESFRDYVADRIVRRGHFFIKEICNQVDESYIRCWILKTCVGLSQLKFLILGGYKRLKAAQPLDQDHFS
ncbi:unnamed protein product [Penicillium salamii]|nr:unnamed protein product [Penicillium salamii]CAG8320070.1 unnamed protein product [Penicillium salamii]